MDGRCHPGGRPSTAGARRDGPSCRSAPPHRILGCAPPKFWSSGGDTLPSSSPKADGRNVSESSIAACIVCRNEGHKLGECLDSVGWTDEVLVLDLESDDDSATVAAERGATVVRRAPHPIVEPLRDEIASHASAEWVLVLDPDERVTPGLAQALPPTGAARRHRRGRGAADERRLRLGAGGPAAPLRAAAADVPAQRRAVAPLPQPPPAGTRGSARPPPAPRRARAAAPAQRERRRDRRPAGSLRTGAGAGDVRRRPALLGGGHVSGASAGRSEARGRGAGVGGGDARDGEGHRAGQPPRLRVDRLLAALRRPRSTADDRAVRRLGLLLWPLSALARVRGRVRNSLAARRAP
jgi:hypothetical protein